MMKIVYMIGIAATVWVLGCATSPEQSRFRMADAETAREYAAWWGGEFLADFGDKRGPYEAVAGAVVTSDAERYHFSAHVDDHISDLWPDPGATNVELKVYYFVNPKGNCYGVIQRHKKE